MLTKNKRRNLSVCRGRLRNVIYAALVRYGKDDLVTVPALSARLKRLGTVRKVADEIINNLESYGLDNRHEFSINAADLKLRLRICRDGFVRGYVSREYESSRAVWSFLNDLLDRNKLLDLEVALF